MTGLPDTRMIQLVMALRSAGISDNAVLAAIERTPREHFVPADLLDQAFENTPLPIDCGQIISQPLLAAAMTQALELHDRCKVLEIGTGSGYQAAVLARLSRRVYTVERHRTLVRKAQILFEKLRLCNIVPRIGDGLAGWPEQAPFDRIVMTAAVGECPVALLDQLKPGGLCVAPVRKDPIQVLTCYAKSGNGAIVRRILSDVHFAPLPPAETGVL